MHIFARDAFAPVFAMAAGPATAAVAANTVAAVAANTVGIAIGIAEQASSSSSTARRGRPRLKRMHLMQIAHRITRMRDDKANRIKKMQAAEVSLSEDDVEMGDEDDQAHTRLTQIVERQLSEVEGEDDARRGRGSIEDDAPEHWAMTSEAPVLWPHECLAEPRRSGVSPLTSQLLGKGIERHNEIAWSDTWNKMRKRPPIHNMLIGSVVVGSECQVEELAKWIDSSTEDILVVSILDTATKEGHLMQTFVDLCTTKSLHESLLLHERSTEDDAVEDDAVADAAGSSMLAAVAVATAKNFVFSHWEGGFIVAHRLRVDAIHWTEWDVDSISRVGTLQLFLHPGKQLKETGKIGIVKMANAASTLDPGVWGHIETWIQRDAPMLITGHFGKNNEQDIAKVAVAAYASVGRMIRVKVPVPNDHAYAFAPGGFMMCAPCQKPIEELSDLALAEKRLSPDLVDAFVFTDPTWTPRERPADLPGYPNIGEVKMKSVAWKKMIAGLINCRMYIGKPGPGKKKRAKIVARAEREEKHRRLVFVPPARLTPRQPQMPPPQHLLDASTREIDASTTDGDSDGDDDGDTDGEDDGDNDALDDHDDNYSHVSDDGTVDTDDDEDEGTALGRRIGRGRGRGTRSAHDRRSSAPLHRMLPYPHPILKMSTLPRAARSGGKGEWFPTFVDRRAASGGKAEGKGKGKGKHKNNPRMYWPHGPVSPWSLPPLNLSKGKGKGKRKG